MYSSCASHCVFLHLHPKPKVCFYFDTLAVFYSLLWYSYMSKDLNFLITSVFNYFVPLSCDLISILHWLQRFLARLVFLQGVWEFVLYQRWGICPPLSCQLLPFFFLKDLGSRSVTKGSFFSLLIGNFSVILCMLSYFICIIRVIQDWPFSLKKKIWLKSRLVTSHVDYEFVYWYRSFWLI